MGQPISRKADDMESACFDMGQRRTFMCVFFYNVLLCTGNSDNTTNIGE